MNYEMIILEKKEGIATITLNRPDKLNALNPQMLGDLADAFLRVDQDDETRVVVLTGTGRAFCSGLDIREGFQAGIERRREGISEDVLQSAELEECLFLIKIKKPVIASINGFAIGLGCTMSLACDIRIASEAAKLSLGFTQLGLPPEFGSTYFLPRLVGIAKACELIFTARTIDAKEAEEIGLVNQVVPAEELAKVTYEMASSIAKLPPQAIRISKRGLYQGMSADLASQLQYENFALNYLRGTEDFEEAINAFLEKRDPVFKGR